MVTDDTKATTGFITHYDLATGRPVWRKLLTAPAESTARRRLQQDAMNTLDAVTAITVSPDSSIIAAYVTRYNNGAFSSSGAMAILRASDGAYVTQPAGIEFKTTIQVVAFDQSLLWNPNDFIIYMTWLQVNTDTAGSTHIGAFDPTNNQFVWVKQVKPEEESYSMTMHYDKRNFNCGKCTQILTLGSRKVGAQWRLAFTWINSAGVPTHMVTLSDNVIMTNAASAAQSLLIDHVGYELYGTEGIFVGTARRQDDSIRDDFIYVFLIQINRQIPDLASMNTGPGTRVLQVRNSIANLEVHMVYHQSDNTLWYLNLSISGGSSYATKIQNEVEGPYAATFLGALTFSGMDQAYIGGAMRTLELLDLTVRSYSGKPSVLLSTIKDENCITFNPQWIQKFNDKWVELLRTATPTSQNNVMLDSTPSRNLILADVAVIDQATEEFCSPLTQPIASVTPAILPKTTLCIDYDSTYYKLAFTPPVANTEGGSTCADETPSWIYSVDQTGVDTNAIKITIDSNAGTIQVLAREDAILKPVVSHTLTVTATLPSDPKTVTQFKFTINVVSGCDSASLISPPLVDQAYTITGPLGFYDPPVFIDNPACADLVTYAYQVSPDAPFTAPYQALLADGVGKALQWQTDDVLLAGDYLVSLQAQSVCEAVPIKASYTLSVTGCDQSVLTPVPSAPLPVTYLLGTGPFNFDSPSFMNDMIDCPVVYSYQVSHPDLEALLIFDTTVDPPTFAMSTATDINLVGTHLITINGSVLYDGNLIILNSVSFDLVIAEDCPNALIIPTEPEPVVNYLVRQGPVQYQAVTFTTDMPTCPPLIVSYSIADPLVQAAATFDLVAGQFTIETDDFATVGTHQVIFTAQNAYKSVEAFVELVIDVDCDAAVLSQVSSVDVMVMYELEQGPMQTASPLFESDTPGCPISYTFSYEDPILAPYITIQYDAVNQPFFVIETIDSALDETEHLILVEATVGTIPVAGVSILSDTFTVRFDEPPDPCETAILSPEPMAKVTYLIGTDPIALNPPVFNSDVPNCIIDQWYSTSDARIETYLDTGLLETLSTDLIGTYFVNYFAMTVTEEVSLDPVTVQFEIEVALDCSLATMALVQEPQDIKYTIGFNGLVTHPGLQIESSIPSCPPAIDYSVSSAVVQDGISLTEDSQSFSLLYQNEEVVGAYIVKVWATLDDQEILRSFRLEIAAGSVNEDNVECGPDIIKIEARDQVDPEAYFYTWPKAAIFDIVPPKLYPGDTTCKLYYTCQLVDGPDLSLDLCNYALTNDTSKTSFNRLTGRYELKSDDPRDGILPGNYTFSITASTAADNSVPLSFNIVLIDPCLTADLTLTLPQPFYDIERFFQEPALPIVYELDSLVALSTEARCGDLGILFTDATTGLAIDNSMPEASDLIRNLFTETEVRSPLREFRIGSISDPELVGKIFSLKYTVFLMQYPQRSVDSRFSVRVALDETLACQVQSSGSTSFGGADALEASTTSQLICPEEPQTPTESPEIEETLFESFVMLEDLERADNFDILVPEAGQEVDQFKTEWRPGIPMPYIKKFTPKGLLMIGWTNVMVPYERYEVIPDARVAIAEEIYSIAAPGSKASTRRGLRRLQDVSVGSTTEAMTVFNDNFESISLLVADALDITLVGSDDQDLTDQLDFSWQVVGYSKNELQLQFAFDSTIETQSEMQITFWGTKYFVNEFGNEVPLGTQLKWKITHLSSPEELERLELIESTTQTALLATGGIVLLLVVCGGPLLPFWMFINSLQLLVHLSLVRTQLPTFVADFLNSYMPLLGLRSDTFTAQVLTDQQVRDSDFADYQASQTASFDLLREAGYHVSSLRTMTLVFALAALIITLWALALIKDSICCRSRANRSEPFWNNFLLRFTYELFLQIALCLVIAYQTQDVQQGEVGSPLVDNACTGVVVFFVVFILAFMMTACLSKEGPQVKGSYKTAYTGSFWRHREVKHLDETECEDWGTYTLSKYGITKKSTPKARQEEDYGQADDMKIPIAIKPQDLSPLRVEEKDTVMRQGEPELTPQSNQKPDLPIVQAYGGLPQLPLLMAKSQSQPVHEAIQSGEPANQDPFAAKKESIVSDSLPAINGLCQGKPPVSDSDPFYSHNDLCEGGQPQNEAPLTERQLIEKNECMERGEEWKATPVTNYDVSEVRKSELHDEAKARVYFSSEAHRHRSNRYKTLSYGLTKNQPHAMPLVHPLCYLLRRVATACILVLLSTSVQPLVATFALQGLTLVMMALLFCEGQWHDSLIRQQHGVNELLLYLALALILAAQAEAESGVRYIGQSLGWIFIALVCFMIAYNIVVMAIYTRAHVKHYWLKRRFIKNITKLAASRSNKYASVGQDYTNEGDTHARMVLLSPVVIDDQKDGTPNSQNGLGQGVQIDNALANILQIDGDEGCLGIQLAHAHETERECGGDVGSLEAATVEGTIEEEFPCVDLLEKVTGPNEKELGALTPVDVSTEPIEDCPESTEPDKCPLPVEEPESLGIELKAVVGDESACHRDLVMPQPEEAEEPVKGPKEGEQDPTVAELPLGLQGERKSGSEYMIGVENQNPATQKKQRGGSSQKSDDDFFDVVIKKDNNQAHNQPGHKQSEYYRGANAAGPSRLSGAPLGKLILDKSASFASESDDLSSFNKGADSVAFTVEHGREDITAMGSFVGSPDRRLGRNKSLMFGTQLRGGLVDGASLVDSTYEALGTIEGGKGAMDPEQGEQSPDGDQKAVARSKTSVKMSEPFSARNVSLANPGLAKHGSLKQVFNQMVCSEAKSVYKGSKFVGAKRGGARSGASTSLNRMPNTRPEPVTFTDSADKLKNLATRLGGGGSVDNRGSVNMNRGGSQRTMSLGKPQGGRGQTSGRNSDLH